MGEARLSEREGDDDSRLLTLARRLGREHQARIQALPGIDEPRWLILLEIFVISSDGREMPFMSAARAAGVAVSTGQRYVHELIEAGLLTQHRSNGDQRITHVRLSERGATLVTQVLAKLIGPRNC